jgi:hypothetical protein
LFTGFFWYNWFFFKNLVHNVWLCSSSNHFFLVTDVALQRVNTHLLIVLVFKVELWCCLRVFKFEIFGLEVGFGIKSLSKEVSNIAWLSLTDCEYTTTCRV